MENEMAFNVKDSQTVTFLVERTIYANEIVLLKEIKEKLGLIAAIKALRLIDRSITLRDGKEYIDTL